MRPTLGVIRHRGVVVTMTTVTTRRRRFLSFLNLKIRDREWSDS
jgi:hypothetical protein